MLRYALRRLLAAIPLLLAVATLAFVLLEAVPGDPADLFLGERPMPPEARERIREAYGFDRPAAERYLHWLGALFLRGELGFSHSRSRPVAAAIGDALGPTLLLAGSALLLHLLLGVGAGVVAAARRGRPADRLLTFAALAVYALPTFWLGLMAILVFALWIPLFPASSMHHVAAEQWGPLRRLVDLGWHLLLPAGVLSVSSAAALSRFVRGGLLEQLGEPFVRAARARGVRRRRALWAHALRNTLLPVINLLGLSLPVLVSGSLAVEVVFAWPGMGRLAWEAARAADHPLLLASTLLAALAVVVGNLLADLAMAAVDPRVRASLAERT